MLHNQIDLTKLPQKPKLYLAKPNKEVIAVLTEAYNIQYHPRLGNISELTFTIPALIEDNHQLIPNPNFQVRDFYLIKLEVGLFTEWFIINQPTKNADDNADVKNLHAFSLGYELKYKRIKDYSVVSYTPQQVLTDALSGTIWNIGTIETSLNSLYRSFDITSTTSILDFVLQIATTFDAVIVWDTEQRTISLHSLNNIGIDRGLRFSSGNLLSGVEVDYDSDNIVTRLHCYGKDGLTISSVNSSGSNFLEDFSYFLDQYSEDSNGNVISHSAYMSDGLAHAQIAYQNLLASKKGDFSTLLSQLQSYQTTLTTQQNDLTNLQTQMDTITDSLDIAQSTGQSTSSLLQQQTNQQSLINAKQSDINTTKTNINNVNSQIASLQSQISIENNFTSDQIIERSQFIFEQDYVNDNIIDPQDLYDLASTEFINLRTPKISVKINVVNFLEILEEQKNWDKLNLGDIVYIHYEKLDVDIQAKITEYQIDFEQGSITLTIANVKEVLNDEKKLIQQINSSISSSREMTYNSYKWNKIDSVQTDVDGILNEKWSAGAREIQSGVDNTVSIDRRGVTSTNNSDPNRFVRLTNGGLIITTDGGNTANLVADATGVYAENLVGQAIAGDKLTIASQNGKTQILGDGITQYASDGTSERIKIGDISPLQDGSSFGMTIKDQNLNQVLKADESGLTIGNAASIAGTTASTLVNTANNAQATANNALTTANNAKSSATTANNLLADMANDNKLTATEKQLVQKEWNGIVSEVSLNDTQATTFGITTEKTSYDNAYSALNTYLTPLLSSLTTTSDIVGSTFRTNFKTYYDARTTLLNAIAAKAKSLADAAQAQANTATTNAANAQSSANTANATLYDIASDNKLTAVEKQTVKIQWDAIVAEKPTLDSQATTYSITTEKTNYDNAYNTLNTYITPLLSGLTTTSDIIGSTFRTNFSNYYTAKINLLNKITNVTSFTGTTVINGGQIQTKTVSTDAVTSNFGSSLDISSNASITSKVSTANLGTAIEQNSDHVKIAVGQIGGNNLLQNTGKFQSLNWWAIRKDASSAATLTIQNGTDNGVTFPALWFNVTALSSYCNLHNDSISTMKFSTAKKYAFSARLYVSKAMTVQVGIMDANGANVVLGWQNYSLPYGYSSISGIFTPLVAGNAPILVIQGLGGTALPYTIVIENCKLEEGENVTAWSPNPNELQQTDVTIDSNGVTIDNGALTVTNPSGTVVIDGTSNMFKIFATGTVNMTVTDTVTDAGYKDALGGEYYNHKYEGIITITHNLGYMPTFFVFEQIDGTSMSTVDNNTTVTVTTTILKIHYYYTVAYSYPGASTPDASYITTYRYYINKEAAF